MIKPTVQTIVDLWQNANHFGGDLRGLRVRFDASKAHLNHYERILFTKNKLPGIGGTLYETLPADERQHIFDMLGELYLILNTYVAASKRYEFERGKTTDNIDMEQQKGEREAMFLTTAAANDEGQAHVVGWIKKTWWIVWEKKIVEKLVRDFEKWIKRLRQFMKLIWGPLPFLTSLSQLQNLEKDRDAEQVGLLEDVSLRKLVVAPSDTPAINVGILKTTSSAFAGSASQQNYGSIREGATKVVVEYKSYEVNRVNMIHDVASNRINRLIALLHEVKDPHFKVLRCINYFDESPQRRIGIIFELPPELDGPPSSLLAALSNSSSSRPSLDARMRLARSLSETLLLLHSVNWLHKSFRSETILLLKPDNPPPPRGTVLDLTNPRVSGFEYSRLDNDFTAGNPDFEIQRNIYRHPDRWDQPTESFSKIHDIYSLGVVLLEIGLWDPIVNFDKGEPLRERYRDANTTKNRLLRHARKRLGFYAGEKYQSLVLRCLEGDFGDLSRDDKIGSELQRQLGRNVSQALDAQ
ncbi:MAG: hypothetical protein Q9218_005101 [Villophora microphyllina]